MPRNDFNDPESSQVPKKSRSSVPQPRSPKQTPSLVNTVGIKTLRSAIRGLENLVETLEAEPSRSPNADLSRRRSLWQNLLFQVRLRLPKKLKLNDRSLTGIIIGIVVVSFWFVSPVFSSKPPTEVASNPSPPPLEIASKPVEIAPTPLVPTPSTESFPADLSSPDSSEILVATEPEAKPPDVSETPPPKISSEANSDSTTEPTSETPVPVPPANSDSTTEPITEPSEPLPEPSPVAIEQELQPQPEPPLELTPEQSLIASIQGQVTEISDRYISALVQSVQPDFRSSRLVVQVSNGWYQLSPQQQDQFSDELWTRSQELDFIKLHLTDPNGRLIARSPVVGSSMVILKRSPSLQKTV